jgi:hypothetical protein
MMRTSYRLAASIGGVFLIAGTLVLTTLGPVSGLFLAGAGSLLIGTGMGFCNTAFLVSTQASAGWSERGMATSSIMFTRIVGNSVGAAVFGAILSRQSRNQTGGRRQNSSSAVRAILDDPPIHIRPVCSRKRGCEGQEPCGFLQQVSCQTELVPEGATHGQILVERGMQRAHDAAPGQASPMLRSAAISTLA